MLENGVENLSMKMNWLVGVREMVTNSGECHCEAIPMIQMNLYIRECRCVVSSLANRFFAYMPGIA